MPEEGGFWAYDSMKRIPIFQAAINAGMEYIDLEWKFARELILKLNLHSSTRVILSYHTGERRYERLLKIYQDMRETPADVYKLVFIAKGFDDNLTSLQLLNRVRNDTLQVIVHAMREVGKLSRILGSVNGNAWTYVSLDSEKETASGQLSLTEYNHYFLAEKVTQPRIIGLVGFPVAQSMGWKLHNRLMHECMVIQEELSIKINDFIYVNFPSSDFGSFWKKWKDKISGLSVTIPHKGNVVHYLDNISSAVKNSGVCNTVMNLKGRWFGFNTDFFAIYDLLKPHQKRLATGVLIIGTGGTAKTAISVLKQLGVQSIYITGRNEKQGKLLENEFKVKFLKKEGLKTKHITGIIQATPVGMFPAVDMCPEEVEFIQAAQIVLDVVYNPAQTKFLQLARKKGCITISGEEMFLRQARKQFEIFSGIDIKLELVRRVYEIISEHN